MADRSPTVAVIGAGTMGAGIAQVAATHGWRVVLMDIDVTVVREAIHGIEARLDRLVEKGRLTQQRRDDAAARLDFADDASDLSACELLIEAIIEDPRIKAKVLRDAAAALPDNAIIATNTSSLSVTKLGEAIGEARRTVGMHFFNPAPIMRLVEIIAGDATDPAIVDRVTTIAQSWGKEVARAADVPGFIVNHVARPYYLEAFRILEDHLATPAQIDETMKRLGGFRMGPLELTDLIGQDVNTATTRSVWEQLDHPPLLRPSALQEQLVTDGHLGRKTGRGVYDYAHDPPTAAIDVQPQPLNLPESLREAASRFVQAIVAQTGSDLENYILARILAGLIVQAAHAQQRGVASAADIDTALKYGVNYPAGPFELVQQAGVERIAALLDALNKTVSDGRFAAPQLAETAGVAPRA